MFTLQREIEKSYAKSHVLKELREYFEQSDVLDACDDFYQEWSDTQEHPSLLACKISNIRASTVLCSAMAHLCTTGRTSLQSLCGSCLHLFKGDKVHSVKLVMEVIRLFVDVGLYEAEYRGEFIYITSLVDLPEDLLHKVSNMAYVPPMVVQPRKYVTNKDGGYLSLKRNLLTGKNQHNYKQNLDFINQMNSTAMAIDVHMINIPRMPSKPLDTRDKVERFKLKVAGTNQVVQQLLSYGNEFYFVYRFDARGRSYASGYQVNPMGDDYSKALINLKKEELINENY